MINVACSYTCSMRSKSTYRTSLFSTSMKFCCLSERSLTLTRIMASILYTSRKDVSCVTEWGVHLNAYNAFKSCLAWPRRFIFNSGRITLLVASTWPFDLGYLTYVTWCSMQRPTINSFSFLSMSYITLSVIKTNGMLKRVIIFFETKFWTFCELMVAKDSTSIHIVKQSTATNKNLHCPLAIGKGPKMYILKWQKAMEKLMDQASMFLTLQTSFHIVGAIYLEGWPIVSDPYYSCFHQTNLECMPCMPS